MPYRAPDPRSSPGDFGAPSSSRSAGSDAPFWGRAVSCMVDTLLIFGTAALGSWLLWSFMYRASCEQVDGFSGETVYLDCSGLFAVLVWPLMLGVLAAAGYLFYVRPAAEGAQSIGMRLGRVRVLDAATGAPLGRPRAALRLVVRTFVSTLLLGLGFWWALWDPHGETLHDKAARSAVRPSS